MHVLPAVLVVALVASTACEDNPLGAGTEPEPRPEPVRAFTYEETTSGLESLISDLMAASSEGDRATAGMLAQSLQVQEPKVWFAEVFGDDLGGQLVSEYEPVKWQFAQLVDLMAHLQRNGQTEIMVERFDTPDDKAAVAYQALALQRMAKRTPLYSVRAADRDRTKVFHLWSFVYQAGWFRWIGKTKSVAREPPPEDERAEDEPDLREFRLRDLDLARKILR